MRRHLIYSYMLSGNELNQKNYFLAGQIVKLVKAFKRIPYECRERLKGQYQMN